MGCPFFGVQSNFCHATVGEDSILPRGTTHDNKTPWANPHHVRRGYHSTEHSETTTWWASVASPTMGCPFFGAQSNFCHATVGEDSILPRGTAHDNKTPWANPYHVRRGYHSTEHSETTTWREDDILPYKDCTLFGARQREEVLPCPLQIFGKRGIICRKQTIVCT